MTADLQLVALFFAVIALLCAAGAVWGIHTGGDQ